MHHHRSTIVKDIRLALFKVFPKVPKIKANTGLKIAEWKRNPQVAETYLDIWKADDSGLLTINTIIMKAISRENREVCIKPSIVAFVLAVCSIVLNLRSKDI